MKCSKCIMEICKEERGAKEWLGERSSARHTSKEVHFTSAAETAAVLCRKTDILFMLNAVSYGR